MQDINGISPAYLKLFKDCIDRNAVSKGPVVLSSGVTSDRYINMRKVTLHPQGSVMVGTIIRLMIADKNIRAIGGPATAAIPIAMATVLSAAALGKEIFGFYTRKEAKDHGLKQLVEGYDIQPGDRVAIVEDVTTSGDSLHKSVLAVRELGAVVVEAISLVDRCQAARYLDWGDTKFRWVLTIEDLDWSNDGG